MAQGVQLFSAKKGAGSWENLLEWLIRLTPPWYVTPSPVFVVEVSQTSMSMFVYASLAERGSQPKTMS
jgi:hypothetical protein